MDIDEGLTLNQAILSMTKIISTDGQVVISHYSYRSDMSETISAIDGVGPSVQWADNME